MKKIFLFGLISLSLALILWSCGEQPPTTPTPTPEPTVLAATATPPPPVAFSEPLTISYGEAVEWLEQLSQEDHADQIRDWALRGLADLLKLDIETVRNAFYDQTPIRDPLFDGIATNPVGPGRSVLDANGNLHILLPADDLYPERTIGMTLDDNRKNSGIDPTWVLVYRYSIDLESQQVHLSPEPVERTELLRQRNGFVEMEMDSLSALEQFLAQTTHLSYLELRDGALVAGGWKWTAPTANPITTEDLSLLQRGYRQGVTEPGFSLDAGHSLTISETLAILEAKDFPGLTAYPDVVDFAVALAEATTGDELGELLVSEFVASTLLSQDELYSFSERYNSAQTEQEKEKVFSLYSDAVMARIDQLIGKDFTNLLFQTVTGKSPFQAARYDGGLQGSDVGMTYFYTDLVAKAWPMEVGKGVPSEIVEGFVSDIKAKTPWGHCKLSTESESGRLWFGLRDEAISANDIRIDLGSITTRVFTLINNPDGSNSEVEPSYSFGRIIWWWDHHYTAIADYEPQYHRLDQLIRWGAAIAWLVDQDKIYLPELSSSQIKQDWHFAEWLNAHPELKWGYDIPFVNPQGVTTEALLTLYSKPFDDCGTTWTFSGGISSPSLSAVAQLRELRPNLVSSIARGGLSRTGTTFSSVTSEGVIANLAGTIRRNINAVVGRTVLVDTVADGRSVWSFGGLKAWLPESMPRRFALHISTEAGKFTQRLSVQGVEIGNLAVSSEATVATVRWQPSILGRARSFVANIQTSLAKPGTSLSKAVSEASGSTVGFIDDAGHVYFPLNGQNSRRWMHIEKVLPDVAELSDDFAFRLGAPGSTGSTPTWYIARIKPTISAPTLGDGTPAKWIALTPEENAGGLFRMRGVPPPGSGAQKMTFRYAGGDQPGILLLDNNQVLFAVDDPIFGLQSQANAGVLLRRDILGQITTLQQRVRSGSGVYAQAVELTDNTVLLVDDISWVVPESHPWHVRVQSALRQSTAGKAAPIKIQHDKAMLVGELPSAPKSLSVVMPNDELAAHFSAITGTPIRGPPTYLHSRLANEILEEGAIPVGGINTGLKVRVVTVQLPAETIGKVQPDILVTGSTEWIKPWVSGMPPIQSDAVVRFVYIENDCEEVGDTVQCNE